MKVEQLIPAFQARLRAFAFGPELDHAATELAKRLATYRRRRADIDDRATLKALALLAEYWDAMGRAQEGSNTPVNCRFTSAGLASGPNRLKIVRVPNSTRGPAAWRSAA